jgi:ubiquinone/menaquinone biosynthesis C-methylase UbiE
MSVSRYDSVADFYVQGWPDTYEDSASQALLSVLGPVLGLAVLDVACGHGRYTREIASRGGLPVVGLDLSSELIGRAVAVENELPLGIRYVCDDLARSTELSDESFDRVVCGFGLSDVDDLDGAIANVARMLRVGGRFVFSILHPCFAGVEDVAGSWPEAGRYYDEQRWFAHSTASTLRQRVGANHRTIATYVNCLVRHGLAVDRVVEPEPSGEWATERPAAARLPLYLVVGATKT